MANRRERQRPSSSAGVAWVSERRSAAAVARAGADPARSSVRASVQPQSEPCAIPSAAAPTPRPSSTVPTASGSRPPVPPAGRPSGRRKTIARPTGTLIRNSARQPTRLDQHAAERRPGGRGQRAAALQAPIAAARRSGAGVGQHDRERGGDHRRGGGTLEPARREQRGQRGRERARRGSAR